MFNEVDADHGDTISVQEWIEFWQNVVGQDCYSEEDVMEELESIRRCALAAPSGPAGPTAPSAQPGSPGRVEARFTDALCPAHVVRRVHGSTGMTVAPRDVAEARRHR